MFLQWMENGAGGPLGPSAVQLVEQVSKQKHVIARILSMEVKLARENMKKKNLAISRYAQVKAILRKPVHLYSK